MDGFNSAWRLIYEYLLQWNKICNVDDWKLAGELFLLQPLYVGRIFPFQGISVPDKYIVKKLVGVHYS